MIPFIASIFEEYRRCTSKTYSSDPHSYYHAAANPFRDRTRAVAIAWLLVGIAVLTVFVTVAVATLAGYLIAPAAAVAAVLLAIGYIVVDLLRWVRASTPDRKETLGREDEPS